MSAVNNTVLGIKRKWSLHLPIFPVGLGLPRNTDKEIEQAPLGCISC